MIINHNMQAMNSHRQLGVNQNSASKSMEKLSSGLRINRAGDDAAGLSISEKMRGQIRGLDQASRNSQDGISLIQTAEGALDESHAILQRMRELAVQGSNDTNVAKDRTAISEEIGQLTKELDRISETTQFNTQNLLDGSFKGTFQIGANEGQTIDLGINGMTAGDLGLTGGVKLNTVTATDAGNTKNLLKEGSYTVGATNVTDAKGNQVGKIAADGKITLAGGSVIDLKHAAGKGSTFTVGANGDVDITLAKGAGTNVDKLAAGDYTVAGSNLMNGDKLVGKIVGTDIVKTDGTTIAVADLGLVAGDVADTKTFTIKGVDVSTSEGATGSIKTLDAAIEKVSTQRSQLGAVQNRLEHTIKNLNNASENTQAAESRIRDVDMAKEMMNMNKNNILNQAAQAMLAQANQAPQQVLQLLR